MNNTSKVCFGVLGAAWFWGMYKCFRLYERTNLLEAQVELITDIMDKQFQKEVDEIFEDITDNYEDD